MIVVETQKQHAEVKVIQLLSTSITTTKVEMVVMASTDVVRKEVLIGSLTKLGNGSSGVLTIRNLIQSLALPIAITGVIGTPQMVFINLIIITHVNKTTNRPLMSSMAMERCRNVDAMHSREGYQEPIAVTIPSLVHRNGHYVRPNKVAFKYLNFKKDVNLDAHVKVLILK